MLLGCTVAGAAPAARPQVLVEDAASPWSNQHGEGYANDLVRAAFAAAGVDIKLVVVPYARCKAQVMQGRATGCFSMSAAPELEGRVRFSDKPLFSVTPRFYFNVQYPVRARSVAELPRGMRVGIVHGYEYPPFVAQLAQRGIVVESALGCGESAQACRPPHRRRAGDDRRNAQRRADPAPGRRAQHRLCLPQHADGIVHRLQHHPGQMEAALRQGLPGVDVLACRRQ